MATIDPKGKIVVVTGATSGLGQAFALDIAKRGAIVALAGRDAARANATRDEIVKAGGTADVFLGDVSTVGGAKALAKSLLAKHPKIDLLVNNAGGTFKKREQNADGVERTFALNALGSWVLERELHGALSAAKGRVVNVATGFLNSYPVVIGELTTGPRKYSGFTAYGRAKQAVVMMTVEQAERYRKDGVTVVSMTPGIVMGTRFGGGQPKLMQAIAGPIMRAIGIACTLEEAQRRFRVAAFDEVLSGAYLVKGKPADLPKPAREPQTRRAVVELLENLTARRAA